MIRLAVVGCGDAAEQYIQVVPRVDAEFVAVVDQDPHLARRTAAALNAPFSAASLDELLKQHAAAFDAVLLHSENCWHADQAQQAMQAGKHVLVEAPVALSTTAAEELLRAANAGTVRLMVGQAERFLPSIRTVHEKLVDGSLGQPGLLRVHRWEACSSGNGPKQQPDPELSGGTVFGPLVRDVDLACWLLGRQPTEVFAVGRSQSAETARVWDYVQLHLGFSGGAMAVIDYYQALPVGDGYFSLSVVGSTGAAYADDHHNMQLLFRGGPPTALRTGQAEHHVCSELREFICAIRENREPSNTVGQGRTAVRVAEAAEQSIATGKSIHLPEE